jgi:pyruvate,orthophosphate dikinase
VVAGIRNTLPIAQLEGTHAGGVRRVHDIVTKLENHFRDMQDVEFTIEHRQAVDAPDPQRQAHRPRRHQDGRGHDQQRLINKQEAIGRVTPEQVDMLLHPQFSAATKKKSRKRRQPARAARPSTPAPAPRWVWPSSTPTPRHEWGKAGKAVIMVRPETKPDDVHGMIASKGILTSRGGATSHAAVVARQFGTPAVCGAEELEIDVDGRMMYVHWRRQGHRSDAKATGSALTAAPVKSSWARLATQEPDFEHEVELNTLLEWADEVRKLGVWANADYPKDAERARRYGAQGIGLCRTEHMFFEEERLPIVQEMIMATSRARRLSALDRLLPVQRGDFEGIFRAMDGLPVIIRLLDPPLHEFLPGLP